MAGILVSACLAGEKCRYDGGHTMVPAIAELVRQGKAVTVCPEVLGGLPVPRPRCQILGGNGYDVLEGKAKIVDCNGNGVTDAYRRGAAATLAIAQQLQPDLIILKEYSPSCGSQLIYDGSFTDVTIPGAGITVALLEKHGFKVISEEQYESYKD